MIQRASLLLLLGCRPPAEPTGRPPLGEDTSVDPGEDTGPPPAPGPGVVVLAGGGSEGDIGEGEAWSATLYASLLAGGDVTGDGAVTVAILSASEEKSWLARYFESLGADRAFGLLLDSPEDADDAALDALFDEVDAVFIAGGDQGLYYDLWNDRRIEALIREVHEQRGGGVGGTSAGAMSMAAFAVTGGSDFVSEDVLRDACTDWMLDASDGGSPIHTDFFGFVGGALIDTHFVERARLGRLAGSMAWAIADGAPSSLLGIGLESQTGLVIRDGKAAVIGRGGVSFLRARETSMLDRRCGQPLLWTDLALDVLTEGWTYDLSAGAVEEGEPPVGAEPLTSTVEGLVEEGDWWVDGDQPDHEARFARVIDRGPHPYSTSAGTDPPLLLEAVAVLDAHDSDRRAPAQEALFRALADYPSSSGFVVDYGSGLSRPDEASPLVCFEASPIITDGEAATLVIDASAARWRSLASQPSAYDSGDGSLHAAGLVGLTLHILADSEGRGLCYDTRSRLVVAR